MWYWCSPFAGFWWLFPLMFIFCMVVMFLIMRGIFMGRFPCGHMHGVHGEHDSRSYRENGSAGKSRD